MPDEKGHAVGAILFSANPNMVVVDDARNHLADHKELYWSVGFRIANHNFSFPIYGFIHIRGGQVEYRSTIRDIIPFSPSHYEDRRLASRVKPEPWIRQWQDNVDGFRSRPWKPQSRRRSALITAIGGNADGKPISRSARSRQAARR